jgi:hypothetical protein
MDESVVAAFAIVKQFATGAVRVSANPCERLLDFHHHARRERREYQFLLAHAQFY